MAIVACGLGGIAVACGGADVPTHAASRPDDEPTTTTTSADASTTDPSNDAAVPPPSNPGCTPDPSKSKYTAESVQIDAGTRTYHLFVPEACDPSHPPAILVLFHGDGGNGESMRFLKFEDKVGANAVLVYPDGPGQTWDLETAPADNNDYKFYDALLTDVAKKTSVDEKRVFLFGHSRGAFFANQLGCFRGDKVRALVAHSGGGPYSNNASDFGDDGLFNACNTPPPAAMMIHGESDLVVSYDNGGKKSLAYWTAKDKCKTTTTPFAPSPCVVYDGCTAGHPVVWCSIPGMGHELWSSASEASWNFFKQF